MNNMKTKNTLVLGASLKDGRYSNLAVNKLAERNIPVTAFGLREGFIGDVPVQTDLKNISNIDTVSLYISPKHQNDYVSFLLQLRPRRIIFNPGTENETLYAILKKENIDYEEACTLVLLSTNQY